MSHQKLFFRQFIDDFFHIGAVLPSSKYLGRAAADYLARKQGPAQVLEAGAGSGAFTREIVPHLTAGDSLDVVEINADLMTFLRKSFEIDPAFQLAPGVAVNFINDDVRKLPADRHYDYIIFSLPLTNFPPAMVEEILTLMMARLKPGGVFSYVKYVFIGQVKYIFSGQAAKAKMQANQEIIENFARQYQIERRVVWRNVPPSWVYYWQKRS